MSTAKLLHHVLAKRAQELGRALGPNQYVPSYMRQAATSTDTPMNGTRPAAADVPPVPTAPAVPPLPGMPNAPITSPMAGGASGSPVVNPAVVPGPNKNIANFAKSSEAITSMNGTMVNVSPEKDKAVAPGVSAAAGIAASGAAMLLKQIVAKKRRAKAPVVVKETTVAEVPKTAAETMDKHVSPGFADAMTKQTARINADAAKVVAKSKVGKPAVQLPPKPIPGLGKNNSAKLADSTCYTGVTKVEPKTNEKKPLPKAALMPAKTAMQFTAPGAPVEPTMWDKIKSTSSDVLGATTNYLKGFGQSPMKWDPSHIAGAAVGAIGAGLLLKHLLGGRKRREVAYEG